MTIIGDVLRQVRAEQEKTLRSLSKESDVSYNDIYKIENGITKKPHAITVGKLSKALGIDLNKLVREKEQLKENINYLKPPFSLDVVEVPVVADLRVKDSEIIGYAYYAGVKASGKNLVAVRISRHNLPPEMNQEIRENDTLIIDRDKQHNIGDLVIYYNNDIPVVARYNAQVDLVGYKLYVVVGMYRDY